MPKTTSKQNKALVLEAFDTLFNRRDYAAAEKLWSPHYIQHSALLREDNRLRALRIALRTCFLSQTWKGFSRESTISVRSVGPSPSSWSRDSCLNLRLALNHIRASLIVMLISQVRNCESCRNCESLLKALKTAFCATSSASASLPTMDSALR